MTKLVGGVKRRVGTAIRGRRGDDEHHGAHEMIARRATLRNGRGAGGGGDGGDTAARGRCGSGYEPHRRRGRHGTATERGAIKNGEQHRRAPLAGGCKWARGAARHSAYSTGYLLEHSARRNREPRTVRADVLLCAGRRKNRNAPRTHAR